MRSNYLVGSDTLAMLLSIALGTTVVALFGLTSPAEADTFGNEMKIFKGIRCGLCDKRECGEGVKSTFMKQITTDAIISSIERLVKWK
jgi:ADP-heptose:LPS heptosyltransferase